MVVMRITMLLLNHLEAVVAVIGPGRRSSGRGAFRHPLRRRRRRRHRRLHLGHGRSLSRCCIRGRGSGSHSGEGGGRVIRR